jgi:hypothetical protein
LLIDVLLTGAFANQGSTVNVFLGVFCITLEGVPHYPIVQKWLPFSFGLTKILSMKF